MTNKPTDPKDELTEEERRILAEVEPYWLSDQQLQLLTEMVEQGKLLATADTHPTSFRPVSVVTRHTQRPDTLILWLDPQGVDDDLTTPVEDC